MYTGEQRALALVLARLNNEEYAKQLDKLSRAKAQLEADKLRGTHADLVMVDLDAQPSVDQGADADADKDETGRTEA